MISFVYNPGMDGLLGSCFLYSSLCPYIINFLNCLSSTLLYVKWLVCQSGDLKLFVHFKSRKTIFGKL